MRNSALNNLIQIELRQVSVVADSLLSIEIGSDGNFGEGGNPTRVEVLGQDRILVEAQGGGGGSEDELSGGAGYSGGGGGSLTGYPGGEGGTDGGDGGHSPFSSEGGPGSGLDISQLALDNFSLSPGAGGAGEYNRAGGGGGLVVTTLAGNTRHRGRAREGPTDGEGYGAGSGNGWGEKGLVLIEILKE